VSLILDALRKLERDKQPRDPSVVVVGHVPWGGRDPGRPLRRTALGAAVVLALGLAGLWLLRRDSPSAARQPGADAVTEPATPRGAGLPAREALVPSPAALGNPTSAPPPAPIGVPPPPRGIDLPAPGDSAPLSPVSVDPGDDRGHEQGAALEATAQPAVAAPAVPPRRDRGLRLTAISERDGRPIALLNDHLVREGDSFDGIRVLRIGLTEVEVEVDGRRQVVSF